MLGVGFSSCDKEEPLTVDVENTAGDLESQIGNLKNVSTLKISGPLNGDDIHYLRGILASESCKVSTLDLSDASIVEGGMPYCTTWTSISDTTTYHYTSKDEIGYLMFFNCTSLTEINLPSSLIEIGESAFYGCSSLAEINIPDSVTAMGISTFSHCRSLYTVAIGSGMKTIGNFAFIDCDRLHRVYCYATTPPSIGSDTFDKTNIVLYVPKGSLEAYKASSWGKRLTNIHEMN